MDLAIVKQMMGSAVPFNATLGLEVIDVADGAGVVRLPDDPRLRNHVQSQHAAGLFAAAEAASGAALIGALVSAGLMGAVTPLAKSAEIAYKKLARGVIDAHATLGERPFAALAEAGKAECVIDVVLKDATGLEVATVKVRWHLRKS